MSVADQLVAINDAKLAIKDSIEAKGVTVGSAPLDEYAELIDTIETGGGEACDMTQPTWVKPSGWPDIQSIFNSSSMPNKRWIILFRVGSTAWSSLNLGGDTTAGSLFYETSDGFSYATSSLTHTWDTAQDIDSGYGYKMRWVIVGTVGTTGLGVAGFTSTNFDKWGPLWLYMGSGTYSAFSAGNSTDNSANKSIVCIEMGSSAQYNSATFSGTFDNCTMLECYRWRNVGTTMTTWGATFSNCTRLFEMTPMPDTVTTVQLGNTFTDCRLLKVHISTGLTTLTGVTNFMSGLVSTCEVLIPTGLTTVMTSGFVSGSGVLSLELTPKVIGITSGFATNTKLREVTFAAGTYTSLALGTTLFSGCTVLEAIDIPEGITTINSQAFLGCTFLKTVTLPSTLTTIGSGAFQNCSSLESITIPASVTTMSGGSIFTNTAIRALTIPAGVTAVANYGTGINEFRYLGTITSGTATSHDAATTTFISFFLLDTSLTLSTATRLLKGNLLNLIASLKDNSGGGPTRTLTLGATLNGRLTAGEIAVGTAKNWTMA